MSRHHLLILVIAVLLVVNVATSVLLFRASKTLRLWEEQMRSPVGYAAVLRAQSEFNAGKLRLFELVELPADGAQEKFTGRFDGPFEIWEKAWFPLFSPPDRIIQAEFVETYNMRMRAMQANPERYNDSVNERETTQPGSEPR